MRTMAWDPQYPFDVSYSYKSRTIILQIPAPAAWARLLIQTLETLTILALALRRHAEAAERQQRTDDLLLAQRRRCQEVYAAYVGLRATGLKHRVSIRALSVDPVFADLRWLPADFNWCVRLFEHDQSTRVCSGSGIPLLDPREVKPSSDRGERGSWAAPAVHKPATPSFF